METVFKKDLRAAVLSLMSNVVLTRDKVNTLLWTNSLVKILRSLVGGNVVTTEDIYTTLHIRLKNLGRACFEEHKNGDFPDHTRSAHAFAYALANDEFSTKEKLSIQFDGETLEEFIDLYAHEDLKEKILNQLLTEKEPTPPSDSDNHTCHYC